MEAFKKAKNNITVFVSRIIKNRNIFVFLFFFALAAFLWFLNALGKEYYSTVNIPYKIENIPQNMVLEKNTVPEFEIEIYGHGYSILKQKIESVRIPVIIDINSKTIPLRKLGNSTKYYILTDNLLNIISKRFGDNLSITGIAPDTVYFNLYDNKPKIVPIIPDIEYKTQSGYMQNGDYYLSSDSVTIYGHEDVLKTINSVKTKHIDLGIIGEEHIKILELEQLPYVEYDITTISIEIPTEKYTEAVKEINIKAINFPENYDFILLPDKAKVYYKTPLSLYNSINEANFEVFVNYNKNKNDEIEIEVKSINSIIEIIKVTPISVTYFLEKKE